jgi:predicted nucleotidyltransferase
MQMITRDEIPFVLKYCMIHCQIMEDPSQVRFAYIAGSHSYGLADKSSDFDLCGYFNPSQETVFGIHPSKDGQKFEKEFKAFHKDYSKTLAGRHIRFNSEYNSQTYKFWVTDVLTDEKILEGTFYEFPKYFQLIKENNPNILESLWIDQSLIVNNFGTVYDFLRKHRQKFFTKKVARTFLGYARSQIKRIDTHRKWLNISALEKPVRASYGLPEVSRFPVSQRDAIMSICSFHGVDITNVEHILGGLGSEFAFQISKDFNPSITALMKEAYVKSTSSWLHTVASLSTYFSEELKNEAIQELKYNADLQHYNSYKDWLKSRNKKRQELEASVGFDCKHGCQVLRILRVGLEIVETSKITLDRRIAGDADFLLALKRGLIDYETYDRTIKPLERKLEELAKLPFESKLDTKLIDKVYCEYTSDLKDFWWD